MMYYPVKLFQRKSPLAGRYKLASERRSSKTMYTCLGERLGVSD